MISEPLLRARLDALGADFSAVLTPDAPDSTNNLAKSLAANSVTEIKPVLIAADYQSGGRGRQGKSFVSPRGGLYLSVLLPTNGHPASEIVGVTSSSAVRFGRLKERMPSRFAVTRGTRPHTLSSAFTQVHVRMETAAQTMSLPASAYPLWPETRHRENPLPSLVRTAEIITR